MKKILATLLFVPAMAQADFWTGNILYSRQTGSDMNQVQAYGYIMGVFDVHVDATFCPTNQTSINVKQVNDIVQLYLEANAHRRHEPAERLVKEAFVRVWPCQNRTPGRGA